MSGRSCLQLNQVPGAWNSFGSSGMKTGLPRYLKWPIAESN